MKRIVLLVGIIVALGISSIGVYFGGINILEDNKKYYEYFKDEQLVGVDGEINLSGIKAEKETITEELKQLFEFDNYDYETYLKLMEDKKSGNEELEKEINNLSNSVSQLEEKKKTLNSEYNVLNNKYEKLRKSTSVSVSTSNNYKFPLINQYPKYQTGCESVALTMLLRYYGLDITPDMVIARLKKGSVPYWENGKLYGGNPELEFVGNPYSKSSYGVYEKPMGEVANSFKSGVQAKSNVSFNEIIRMVQGGKPVMVWTSMGLALPYISSSWIYKPTMEVISWKANEHAVVMIDATDSTVVIADPIGGKIKTYSRALFEQRYNYFGKKALYYL